MITDSGSSCVSLPTGVFDMVINQLSTYLTGKTHYDHYWGVTFDIKENLSNLPTIDFLYGGYWFQMTVENYTFDLGYGLGAFCL